MPKAEEQCRQEEDKLSAEVRKYGYESIRQAEDILRDIKDPEEWLKREKEEINDYTIDTMAMYQEGRDDTYFEQRCQKNKTNMTFYIYID